VYLVLETLLSQKLWRQSSRSSMYTVLFMAAARRSDQTDRSGRNLWKEGKESSAARRRRRRRRERASERANVLRFEFNRKNIPSDESVRFLSHLIPLFSEKKEYSWLRRFCFLHQNQTEEKGFRV
jgi:hypothetical protein